MKSVRLARASKVQEHCENFIFEAVGEVGDVFVRLQEQLPSFKYFWFF